MVDGRARHVGEERVPRLGDEEADDGEHGHAAVLGLGLAVAADVVVRRLGREAAGSHWPIGASAPGRSRQKPSWVARRDVKRFSASGISSSLPSAASFVEAALADGATRRGRGRDGEGEGELGEGHCCRLSAGGGAGQVSCNVAPDTPRGRVERRAAAQRATLRNARACTALRYSQRASARR